jgi:hypothetical protein
MSNLFEKATQKLWEKQLISDNQKQEIDAYRSKNIFSIHTELLFLLYISVVLFTSGVGIFVYKNIDTIGHLAILTLNFLLMLVCFIFCFKKAKVYSNEEVFFDNPVYDYIVLTGSILACIFLSYANYQYHVFDSDYQWVSLISAVLCFVVAYYFDNKMVLSMAITALAAFLGISVTPKNILGNEIYNNIFLTYSGILLSIALILWMEYSLKKAIKKHFYFVFVMFALHLAGVCLISGLISDQWYVFLVLTVFFVYYFLKLSYRFAATSVFVFTLIYGYIALIILLAKLFEYIYIPEMAFIIIYASPLFYIGSIFLFIRLVRDFNKKLK